MEWTKTHTGVLKQALEHVLGTPQQGALAFVRCLAPKVIEQLARDPSFAPRGWTVKRVADVCEPAHRTVTADQAVEVREGKQEPTLLLVDTQRAGAGMDGIYSAATEVLEDSLFDQARRIAARLITSRSSAASRRFAEQAVKKARRFGQVSISEWLQFDFLCRVAEEGNHPGGYLYLLGLWPVHPTDDVSDKDLLEVSRVFVDRLFGLAATSLTPAQRIETLRLYRPTQAQLDQLEAYLHSVAGLPLLDALAKLEDQRNLWVGVLRLEPAGRHVDSIEIVPWRTKTKKLAKWSGLVDAGSPGEPPLFLLRSDAEKTGDYSKLEVRWKTRPQQVEKGAVEYRVSVQTGLGEEITDQTVVHSGKEEQKCRFTNDDFSAISEDARIPAKIVISVVGGDSVEEQETEEFIIEFGSPPETQHAGAGKRLRAFSEGLVEVSKDIATRVADSLPDHTHEGKDCVTLRVQDAGKSFRVHRPSLVAEVEKDWTERGGAIGRWVVSVRRSGEPAGPARFVPIEPVAVKGTSDVESAWGRVKYASRRLAEHFGRSGGGPGQVYSESSKVFETIVREYILAWAAALDVAEPGLALAQTVEIQSLSRRTIGLIVLPAHPLRVAWHAAYDNLVLHSAFEHHATAKHIRDEFAVLDGAMFPPFLPGIENGPPFIFADTLGFHTVGMVPATDKEPKATVALLARALDQTNLADTVPSIGNQSATVLGNEILKYLECHDVGRLITLHALRPGDGMTVARALGRVHQHYEQAATSEGDETAGETPRQPPAFNLELYPSRQQQGVAGRYIAAIRERRRAGSPGIPAEDRWLLESATLPGGVRLPYLRWARKDAEEPAAPAHLAIAFDTFESSVAVEDQAVPGSPSLLYAYGLLSFFQRRYLPKPSPSWIGWVNCSAEGEKHPSERGHTDRLHRLHAAVLGCVARSLGRPDGQPVLKTVISPEKEHNLRTLHRRCDWVITLDRSAGIEYFDSPQDDPEVYDAYVIDCVPEREDLGCLQLITSTGSIDEVRLLLDKALDQMGLSRSRRNAEFLMRQLKALSGRLAIRLTGQNTAVCELVALAMSRANCEHAPSDDRCWTALHDGFFVPVDDVRDLLPPVADHRSSSPSSLHPSPRPDLIFVTTGQRGGLVLRFIEVKYRRHLRDARSSELLRSIHEQVAALRSKWDQYYSDKKVCPGFIAVRRAKLARVLHFYLDKAHRHGLPNDRHRALKSEINRLVEKGTRYTFAPSSGQDRGWVFCPECAASQPLEISPSPSDIPIFLFGPALLPDSHPTPTIRPSSELIRPSPRQSEAAPPPATVSTPDPSKSDDNDDHRSGPGDAATSTLAICLGTDQFTGADVNWDVTTRGNPHLLVAGLPGMGKTTCLLNICKHMVAADVLPIIFSYHQDIDDRLQHSVEKIRFADFQGLGFNPLRVIDRTSPFGYLDVAGALRDIFAAIFPEIGDIQAERIRKAIKESFLEIGWGNPGTDLAGLAEPPFRRFLEILRSEQKPDRGLRALLSRLEELADYGFFDTGGGQPSIWESDAPVVIRIHKTQNANLQNAFASLVFYGLYKDMFRRGLKDRITHVVVFDEAHRAARLKLIPTMAKECRKYGISLVLASQEARDFHASLFSAVANYLVLKLNEPDAKALVRNVASSQQERTLIDKIKQMDRFKALYFSEGRSRPSLVKLKPESPGLTPDH